MQTRSLVTASIAACGVFAGSVAMGQGRLLALDRDGTLYSLDRFTGAKTPLASAPYDLSTSGGMTCWPGLQSPVLTVGYAAVIIDCCYDGPWGSTYWMYGFDGVYADPAISISGVEFDTWQFVLYGVGNAGLYTIDLSAGLASPVGDVAIPPGSSLVYDSTAQVMYLASTGTDSLYVVDPYSPAVTFIGPLVGPTNPTDLAYVPEDDAVYLVCTDSDMLYTVNRETGAATAVGSTGPGELVALAWIPDPPPRVCSVTSCWCDYDMNGGFDGGDIGAFLADYEAGAPCADLDQDGGITPADVAFFMGGFETCCC